MKIKLAVALLFLLTAVSISQTGDKVVIWAFVNGKFSLVEVKGLTKYGTYYQIPQGETFTSGEGIMITRSPGQPSTIQVDTMSFYMWVPAPTAPGSCENLSVPLSDQKFLASDSAYLYVCTPVVTNGQKQKIWGRMPLEFTW